MKQLIFTILILLPGLAFAQLGQTYGKGVINLTLGAGFPNATHTAINAATTILEVDGENNGKSTPLFMAGASYGMLDEVEIGVYGGYFKSESEILSAANFISQLLGRQSYGTANYRVVTVGGKLVYHRQLLPQIPKLDLYASTYLGWNFVKDDTDINVSDNPVVETPIGDVNLNDAVTALVKEINYPSFTYEVNVGGKYAVSSNLNIYLEAGYGRYLVNAGIAYSIPTKVK